MPATDVLNGDAATTPVTVIEAKGHNSNPAAADVARGITQAHAHLPEVNLGYVAAPAPSITDTARAQARNLNVGVIAVDDTETAHVVEPARVTGAGEFSTTIDAVRLKQPRTDSPTGVFQSITRKTTSDTRSHSQPTATLTPSTPTTSSTPSLVDDAAQSC